MTKLGHWLLLVCCLGWNVQAAACTICAPSALESMLTQRLFAADIAVIAIASPNADKFEPKELIKGEMPQGMITPQESDTVMPPPRPKASVLLLYSAGSQTWRAVGPLALNRAEWARQLVTLGPAQPLVSGAPAAAWIKRLNFFVGDLENPEFLVAQTAYEEISLAPYPVMRTLKSRLDPVKLLAWLDAPVLTSVRTAKIASRRSLYALLLGIAGDHQSATAVESKLLTGLHADNPADVSGLFAAMVELRGSAGVEWIERTYLANPQRSDSEIQAAVLALSVHGNDGERVSKDRVVQAFAVLIRSNKARAGFVASDLGNWGRWEFGTDYVALLKSGEPQVFASRYAMLFYLMRNPLPQARAAYEELRAGGFL